MTAGPRPLGSPLTLEEWKAGRPDKGDINADNQCFWKHEEKRAETMEGRAGKSYSFRELNMIGRLYHGANVLDWITDG